MFVQKIFIKLSAAVHALSCLDDAENHTAVASAGSKNKLLATGASAPWRQSTSMCCGASDVSGIQTHDGLVVASPTNT